MKKKIMVIVGLGVVVGALMGVRDMIASIPVRAVLAGLAGGSAAVAMLLLRRA